MHVIVAVMVMMVTFFTFVAVMTVLITIIVMSFLQKRLHFRKIGNSDFFCLRRALNRFSHKRFHIGTNPYN